MYVYQNGKLYTQKGDKLVGVDICSDIVLEVEGTECDYSENYKMLDLYEVVRKFQTIEGQDYKFPREAKTEVVKDEPVKPVKRATRKSTSK